MCALILWRADLGLLIRKFRRFLTELSVHDTIMVGYYRFTFYCKDEFDWLLTSNQFDSKFPPLRTSDLSVFIEAFILS